MWKLGAKGIFDSSGLVSWCCPVVLWPDKINATSSWWRGRRNWEDPRTHKQTNYSTPMKPNP